MAGRETADAVTVERVKNKNDDRQIDKDEDERGINGEQRSPAGWSVAAHLKDHRFSSRSLRKSKEIVMIRMQTEIAEGENEGEGGAGEQARNGKRQDDAQKCLKRSGAEVVRGFDKRTRDVFECRVDGQKNERRVDVREHENDSEWAVEKERDGRMREMQVLQEAIEDAFAAENGFPSVTAHQVTHPQRHDDELVEQLFAGAGMKRQVIGQRVAEQQGAKRHRGGDAYGAQEDSDVNGLGKESHIIVQVPLVDQDSVVDGPETVREHQRVGKQEEQADPEERRERDERFVRA